MKSLAVIGGGASGMCAAIFAKRENRALRVVLFEKNERVGKKILSTGNGRCNLTNLDMSEEHYFGDKEFIKDALSRFGVRETLEFFEGLGLSFRYEEKRVYPRSNQAATVLDALRFALAREGIELRSGEAADIARNGGGFIVNNEKFDAVIIAVGGKAAPHTGSDGSFFPALSKMGLKLNAMTPALVQLRAPGASKLKGVRAEAAALLIRAGKVVRRDSGEVQFTDYGLSGIVIMQLSTYAEEGDMISLDLLPEMGESELFEKLKSRRAALGDLEAADFICGFLNKRLSQCVLERADVKPQDRAASLDDGAFSRIAGAIKRFDFTVSGKNPWRDAQVTRGGLDTNGFTSDMQSKTVPRLFVAGEALDVCGDCGGYNLQWAWTSGAISGKGAAACLK